MENLNYTLTHIDYILVDLVSFDDNSGFDIDLSNLLQVFSGAFKIKNSFEDSHFVFVEGIGSVTTWRSSGGDSQNLLGHPFHASDLHGLVVFLPHLSSSEDFRGDYFY
jgi:hypothetical protein